MAILGPDQNAKNSTNCTRPEASCTVSGLVALISELTHGGGGIIVGVTVGVRVGVGVGVKNGVLVRVGVVVGAETGVLVAVGLIVPPPGNAAAKVLDGVGVGVDVPPSGPG